MRALWVWAGIIIGVAVFYIVSARSDDGGQDFARTTVTASESSTPAPRPSPHRGRASR